MSKRMLVTGAAGFIGSHVAEALLRRGDEVVGVDSFTPFYDPARKRRNVEELQAVSAGQDTFRLAEGDIRDPELAAQVFAGPAFDAVIHLAALAGVRDSIRDPAHYYDVNLNGTLVLLEAAVGRLGNQGQGRKTGNFVFASTSSVYGLTKQIPFVETDPCDRPLAPYAASKRAGEMLGYTYHRLYGLPFTALRFFTVYGPRGRPDMMAYKVADSLRLGRDVPLYNNGQMHRDWTYVHDIVAGVVAAADRPLEYEIINLGRGQPVLLADFVRYLEQQAGRKARLVPAPIPDADMPSTYADTSKAERLLGYRPRVSVEEGVRLFWEWYCMAVPG
jgi:UDP-glucuronate 4-epimerase